MRSHCIYLNLNYLIGAQYNVQKEMIIRLHLNPFFGKTLLNKITCRVLYAICRKSGLRPVGWHTLRHTFASHLVEAGAPMRAIQDLLGHYDLKMTMRYAHLSPSVLTNTINLLDHKSEKVGSIWAMDAKNSVLKESQCQQRSLSFG